MTMNASEAAYDLVLTGARICDPATGLDRNCDLAVNGDRIAAIGAGLAAHAGQVIKQRRWLAFRSFHDRASWSSRTTRSWPSVSLLTRYWSAFAASGSKRTILKRAPFVCS
jgi:hypothetical protein